MFKKFTEGFQSTLAQAGEQAKARNGLTGSASPRPSTSGERPVAQANPPVHVPYEEGNLDSDNEEKEAANGHAEAGDVTAEMDAPNDVAKSDPELQKRLNKLAKYEKKYPELLKAYRALQVQDTNVKAFEKVLGETTPATSVLDIEAFQQWASNFKLKADMAMDELRRVSKEQDSLAAQLRTSHTDHEATISQYRARISELEGERSMASTTEHNQSDTLPESEQRDVALQAENKRLKEGLEHVDAELKTTKDALLVSQEQLRKTEQRNAQVKQQSESDYQELQSSRDALRKELTELKISHAKEILEVRKSLRNEPIVVAQSPQIQDDAENIEPALDDSNLSKGQKKRRNKKKAASKVIDSVKMPVKETEMLDTPVPSKTPDGHQELSVLLTERDELLLQVSTLTAQADAFADERDKFERNLKKSQEHQESIEELRDMLRDVGNDLVETKDQVKALALEKATLVTQTQHLKAELNLRSAQVADFEARMQELQSAASDTQSKQQDSTAQAELREQMKALENKLASVTKDLEIAERLSAERFKELTTLKDNLRLQVSELNDLRRSSQKDKTNKAAQDANLKSIEARSKALERAEKDRRDELEKSQRNLASREKELKVIQTAFKEEETRRKSEETRAASLKAEVTKLTTLRDSIISSRNELTAQLASMRGELDSANTKVNSLQQLKNKLTQERDAAQEELQLGQAKFDSSYSLMESQREQTTDMQHRLRETTERHEAMEEELSEAQRQLTERAREAETLRRLLSEVEGGQEARLREMRDRMEIAIAERDKAEDEAAFTGKKRAREVEDLKEKLTDLERAQRKLTAEKHDLGNLTDELKKAAEVMRGNYEEKEHDLRDLRGTMTDLSSSLREAESQITALEGDRESLRAALKDSSSRLERLNTEISTKEDLLNKLRLERAHMLDKSDGSQSPAAQSRKYSSQRSSSITSIPSSPVIKRSPSMQSVSLNERPIEKAEVDREYIKNVLFQFIEHKEKRKYLMPAITKLLLLSKQQEGVFANSLK